MRTAPSAGVATFLQGHGVAQVTPFDAVDQLEPLLAGQDPPRLVIVHIDPTQRNRWRSCSAYPRFSQTSFFVMSALLEASLCWMPCTPA